MWVVNVDVLCLNHDGNLLDAATLSAMAALKNGRFVWVVNVDVILITVWYALTPAVAALQNGSFVCAVVLLCSESSDPQLWS